MSSTLTSEADRSRADGPSVRRPSIPVRLGSLPADSEEDLRFVQDRLALFGKTTFLISGMFLLVTSTADLVAAVPRYSQLARVCHVVGTLSALALWRIAASRRPLSPVALHGLDASAMLGICWTFAGLGHFGLQPYGAYTAMLAITHVSVSRAIVVPSLPRRTFWLGLFGFASLVVSRAVGPLGADLAALPGARARVVIEAVLWSTAGTAVSTLASAVIYGLQKKALQARQLGQYTLEEKIGEGGMGQVFRARHAMLRRPTAIKLLSSDGSEEQLRRFEKEVRLTARLTHPNTISIYDYGRTPSGIFYYAMELLDGLTLEDLVAQYGPQPPSRVIHLLLQVCGALREAHGSGLIHRDIKPANVFLCRRGDLPDFVKVLDFGLVRQLNGDGDSTRSSVNAVVGSPMYLSPEAIITPARLDARADIYGLGCLAYYLATGEPPFQGRGVVELCAHHLHSPPVPPSSRADVPADLERVILACLAKKPENRPDSVRAVAHALRECRDARGWDELAAEQWWATVPSVQRKPRPDAASGIALERTICCADLERRLDHSD
ncbi:MAG TPA: serine/threonine-protein kinase [Polyangiaceae bacterium]|nr:serine/threonine-protein kinase [Polyangiaceae bacterium]